MLPNIRFSCRSMQQLSQDRFAQQLKWTSITAPLQHFAQICQETGKEQEVQVPGAADKAACLRRWKSSCRQLPIRTASISDAPEGNDWCVART